MLDISCKNNLNNNMENLPTFEEWTERYVLDRSNQISL